MEWNPPADRPRLADALRWPAGEWFQPRIITVPPEVHRTFPHADALPLFQMLAKNAGIRRAAADFVLATNIDILLSDVLFEFLGGVLRPRALYRVDRYDIVAPLDRDPLPTPAECRALPWVRVHKQDGTHSRDGVRPPWYARARTQINRTVWEASHGGRLPRLHTWASGDFTLTSARVWTSIRGYPEWAIFSMFLDSVFLVQAYAAGVEMINLEWPMLVQHLEHGTGSGWTPEGARTLAQRLDAAGIPYLDGTSYDRVARNLLREGRGVHTYNTPQWGLADQELEVVEPASNGFR